MTDLSTRIASAECGSRELDAEVAGALGWTVHNARRNGMWAVTSGRPYSELTSSDDDLASLIRLEPVTTCVTAALALVDRVLPGLSWSVGQNVHHKHWSAWGLRVLLDGEVETAGVGSAATAPLALCAALLSAKGHAK